MPTAPHLAYLGSLTMSGKGSLMVGEIPAGRRRLDYVAGGTLEGPGLRAEVVAGSDHLLRLADGTLLADVRLALRLDDGYGLELTYRGYLTGVQGVGDRLLARQPIAPDEYSIRTQAWFDTGSEKYRWLNPVIAVGQGRFGTDAAGKPVLTYEYFRVL
jgi:hypothetical protein